MTWGGGVSVAVGTALVVPNALCCQPHCPRTSTTELSNADLEALREGGGEERERGETEGLPSHLRLVPGEDSAASGSASPIFLLAL